MISLGPYVDIEVERLTNNIVDAAVRKKMQEKKYGPFLMENSSENGETFFSYDTVELNLLKNEITSYVQKVLSHLDCADIEDDYLFQQLKTSKFKKIKNGILAENSINSLRGSTLFGNMGPSIPIRLYFVGQVSSKIDIFAKEYGINNVLVEVYLIIKVKEQVMMPISSKSKEIEISELVSMDVVRGKVPSYYGGFSK